MKSKLEFLLNYYFEIYKDKVYANSSAFRREFKKKHGEFQLINELIVMITKYQIKKYGTSLITNETAIIENDYLRKEMKYRNMW